MSFDDEFEEEMSQRKCPCCGSYLKDEPRCFVKGCSQPAEYEAWARNHDFSGAPTGMISKIFVCETHTSHPYLCANKKDD